MTKVTFSQLDPILGLHEKYDACGDTKPKKVTECPVCKIKDPKKLVQCEFCAEWLCNTCAFKQYPYPVQHLDLSQPNIEPVTGLICIACECKLHINRVSLPHF
jgi:hypothetical protein